MISLLPPYPHLFPQPRNSLTKSSFILYWASCSAHVFFLLNSKNSSIQILEHHPDTTMCSYWSITKNICLPTPKVQSPSWQSTKPSPSRISTGRATPPPPCRGWSYQRPGQIVGVQSTKNSNTLCLTCRNRWMAGWLTSSWWWWGRYDACTTVHLQKVLQLVSHQLSCLYQVHISSSSENSSLQSFYFSHLPAFSSHISSPSTLGTFSPTILPLSTSGLSAPTTLPPLLFSDTWG